MESGTGRRWWGELLCTSKSLGKQDERERQMGKGTQARHGFASIQVGGPGQAASHAPIHTPLCEARQERAALTKSPGFL
jgi:hypothetical protein